MTTRALPFAYFRRDVRPADQATISIASNSLQYGTTCFGGIRGYRRGNKIYVFRLKDHYERLMNASKIMAMGYYLPYAEFADIIGTLIAKNRPAGDVYLRPFLFSEDQQLAPRLQGLTFELAIYLADIGQYFPPEKGLRLGISSWKKFSDHALPTKAKAGGCYVNSVLATAEAIRSGYDEALMTDQEGNIVEASIANILMVYRDRVLSPPIGSAMLEGITMRSMVALLADEGTTVEFERIDRSMVYTCQELMLLGTAAQLSFAESVDGRVLGDIKDRSGIVRPGPVCQLLREKFEQVISNRHPRSAEWLSEYPA